MAATRRRSTTPEGREQRDRILRAALRLFTAQGFRGASLDAVAAEVGISRQGVLHYFPSKTHLLLGVLDLRDETTIARAEERHESDFADGLIGVVADNQREPDLVRLYTVLAAESVAPEHPGHDRFQERYRSVRAALAAAIAEAQQEGQLDSAIDPVHLATLLTAVMDGLQLQFLLDPESVDMVEPLTALFTLLRARR
jgi:AcrR family transcriptional regulator